MRALDLVSAMVEAFRSLNASSCANKILLQVNRNNLQSIVQQLLQHLVRPDSSLSTTRTAAQSLAAAASTATAPTIKPGLSPTQSSVYRAVIAQRILSICSADLYSNVSDFQWYVSVLVDLAYVARAPVGSAIRDQLVDVAVRVRQVRQYAVQVSLRVLLDETFVSASDGADADGSGCQEVLWAAAWICGEYARYVTYLPVCRVPSLNEMKANSRTRRKSSQHFSPKGLRN